jgi:protein-arginine kinase activator protein McsA
MWGRWFRFRFAPLLGFWFRSSRRFPRREEYLHMLVESRDELEEELAEVRDEIEQLK